MFNFDTRGTNVSASLKIASFPLCKYALGISWMFFYCFLASGVLFGMAFFEIAIEFFPLNVAGFFFCAWLFFLELHFFVALKIKKPALLLPLAEALESENLYNLAEFLSLESCKVVEVAIAACKKRRLSAVGSEALLYAIAKQSKDGAILLVRLGIDPKKLQVDIKNYLEKQPRQKKFSLVLSGPFQKVVERAAKVALDRGKERIGEKELMVALAIHDEFFKKLLIEHDLKEKDLENITQWLDSIQTSLEKSRHFWKKENLARKGSLGRDWASGYTITLDRYSIDWTQSKRRHIFNEIIGHKKEVTELEAVLAKSNLSNALIVGDVGVGRKSIIEALAQRCYLGLTLPELKNKRVVELDMVALLSAIGDNEKLESVLNQILEEVAYAGNIILVIDQLDNFVEQKAYKLGEVDISGILARYLAAPNFHFVGITSFQGLHTRLEKNAAMLEYFRKIEVREVSELETIQILQNLALEVEYRDRIFVMYPSIREIVNLTGRYFPSTPFPKKAIDVLYEAATYLKQLKEKVVLPHHIAKIISEKTQIPVGKMEFKEKSVLLNLEALIHEHIVNQAEAVAEISIAMRRARSGISSQKRPMGTFLFLGPTGVGKTETAKALGSIYFGGVEKMISLDMSEFQAIEDIPRLLGAVSPVEQQGLLTTPVRENPFSLVLLDEIEKAHPDILNLFLQVFDEGHITDGQGRKVVFSNTIIICTSNAGAASIFESVDKGIAINKDELLSSLFAKNIFRPEFVNRFDATVIFHPLTKENLMDIAQLMLASLAKKLAEKDVVLSITESLKEKIVELSYKPEFGAREMRRVLQDTVENAIAEVLLSDKIVKGDKIEINPENFEVVKLS